MRAWTLVAATVGLTFVACDNTVFPPPQHSPAGAAYSADWDGVNDFFTDNCISCHAPGATSPELPAAIIADLQEETGRFVVPGDPAASKLWRVVSGELADNESLTMPLGAGLLPPEQVEHIKAWIEDGASLEGDVPDPPDPDLADEDEDGFPVKVDCDDTLATVFPGAEELCNGIDDDCDEVIDDNATDAKTFYADTDADTFGDPNTATVACEAPTDHVEDNTDCDDSSAAAKPGGTEVCDSLDNDCNGQVDGADASDASTWYPDGDEDGYGQDKFTVVACTDPSTTGAAYADKAADCNDLDPAFNPGAEETSCTDPNDYNCDGSVGANDGDGDGFFACEECDDTDPAVNPNASEICNETDDDCDGEIDNDAPDASTWFKDGDGDTFGLASDTTVSCAKPIGYVGNDEDCDDSAAAIKPGATEVCDDADNDCDDDIDDDDDSLDASTGSTFYADTDGDDFGDASSTAQACEQPTGFVTNDEDCDDTKGEVNPGVTNDGGISEDGVDNDCDGRVDQDGPNAPIYWEFEIKPLTSGYGCNGCHSFMGSYDNLKAKQIGGSPLVEPGDAAASYLPKKIDDNPPSGSRMPNGGARMDQADIDLIVQWINEGAHE